MTTWCPTPTAVKVTVATVALCPVSTIQEQCACPVTSGTPPLTTSRPPFPYLQTLPTNFCFPGFRGCWGSKPSSLLYATSFFTAPLNNRTENGLMCPSCIAPFQETCPGTQAARCVGRETHCIYFAGNVQAGEWCFDWGRGCLRNRDPHFPHYR